MITMTLPVPRYHRGEDLSERVLDALARNGKDVDALSREDLGGFDEIHPGGRDATRELAQVAGLRRGMELLDVGCRLGGAARTLVAEFGCRATGVDADAERLRTAALLSRSVGMEGRVEFRRARAADLPFPDGSFDVVWVQHTAAGVEDKRALFSEARRVLKPRGRLAAYEACSGAGGSPRLPVPWVEETDCFLVSPEELRGAVEEAGFECFAWEDRSQAALGLVYEALGGAAFILASDPPPLGLNLVVDRSAERRSNLVRNLEEDRMRVVQGVFLAR